MYVTTPAMRELAGRLVALEAATDERPEASGSDVARACEKLRGPIVKFAGIAGYRSLLSRAVVIAKSETASLETLQVRLDGSLEGLRESGQMDAMTGIAVLVHLLSLLVTFIGEPLTLVVVSDAWPDLTLE